MNDQKRNEIVLYIATSLDGMIARPNGSVDWLLEYDGGDTDYGYAEFYATLGGVVMGRSTYEEVLKLSDVFPYRDLPCYVLSRSEQPAAPFVTFTDGPVDELARRLKREAEGDVWLVGGGQLVREFLERDLLDRMIITIVPKLLGDGIPLFPRGTVPSDWVMESATANGPLATIVCVPKR